MPRLVPTFPLSSPHAFQRRFPTEEVCLAFLFKVRYSETPCKACGKWQFHRHPRKPCFTCSCGRYQIYPRARTIFAASALPLCKWFRAVFLLYESDGRCSAKELQRQLKVTYATAWRMKRKICGVLKRETKLPPTFDELLRRCSGCEPMR